MIHEEDTKLQKQHCASITLQSLLLVELEVRYLDVVANCKMFPSQAHRVPTNIHLADGYRVVECELPQMQQRAGRSHFREPYS